eukprot:jgi/Ulvmu1/8545/UM044_0079.1
MPQHVMLQHTNFATSFCFLNRWIDKGISRMTFSTMKRSAACKATSRAACVAKAAPREVSWQQKAAAVAVASALSAGTVADVASANEFSLLAEPTPTTNYIIDDAGALSKTTRKAMSDKLKRIEIETGYRIEAVTVRKLEVEADAFAFTDRLIESWYPTKEEGDKKGVLLIVTAGKDGALNGGASFMSAVGDDFIDSIIGENIPIFTIEEKYNECLTSSVRRIEAVLGGEEDPGPPIRNDAERKRTYKTKDEVDRTKTVSTTVVGTLLIISVVVPMLQYYGYTSRD